MLENNILKLEPYVEPVKQPDKVVLTNLQDFSGNSCTISIDTAGVISVSSMSMIWLINNG